MKTGIIMGMLFHKKYKRHISINSKGRKYCIRIDLDTRTKVIYNIAAF